MSWEAISYVINKKTKVGNSTAKHVLIYLCNYADENFQSYPSIGSLAELSETNERTVKRALDYLQKKKFITISERFTSDGKQTSNLYTINPKIGGDKKEGVWVTKSNPNTININNNKNIIKRGDKKYPADFEEFWNAYPRNDGSKKKAFILWEKAIDQEIDQRELFLKVCRFKHDNLNTEKKYIPHATTWLYQKRWETISIEKPQTTKNQIAG
tara:strand:- start:8426 stop:9064 length:639 start_codon:yes stop_codon:yes gene_type:complete